MKTNVYETYAAALVGKNLVLYCFDKNLISINDFVIFEAIAQTRAMQNNYDLFDVYRSLSIGIVAICRN
jgi:hypothetical protein